MQNPVANGLIVIYLAHSLLAAESETEGFPELDLAKSHLQLAMSGTRGSHGDVARPEHCRTGSVWLERPVLRTGRS